MRQVRRRRSDARHQKEAAQEVPELQEQGRADDLVDLVRAQGQRMVRHGLREKDHAARGSFEHK